MSAEALPSNESVQHVVLLGASNLTLGWRPLLEEIQATVSGAIDMRVALGMGRSYLEWSGFWARRLPGILQSQLWESLPDPVHRPPLVLLTDIGNDIVYDRSPEDIFEAVQRCVQRIRAWNPDSKLVITGLPLESVSSIGPLHFRIARTILFPGCRLSLATVTTHADRLNQLCHQFAHSEAIPIVVPQRTWYGVDPIHVLPEYRHEAFRSFFASWFPNDASLRLPSSTVTMCPLPTARHRTLLGVHRHVVQPIFQSSRLCVSAY